jgi:dihydrofolate reductase
MRKIVAGLFISLDGVVELRREKSFKCLNDEVSKGIRAGIAQADAVLLGRRTYQQFAKIWPSQGSYAPMARFLNRSPKYVIAQKSLHRVHKESHSSIAFAWLKSDHDGASGNVQNDARDPSRFAGNKIERRPRHVLGGAQPF